MPARKKRKKDSNSSGKSAARDYIEGDVYNTEKLVKIDHFHATVSPFPSKEEADKILSADLKQLHELLLQKGKESCVIDSVLDIEPVSFAPLQITEKEQRHHLDEIGHYHRRREIAELISKPPKGDVTYQELFKKSKEFAEMFVSKHGTYLTDEAKAHRILVRQNIVAISGQAGIGKTTLTKVILKDVIDNNLYGAKFVFYLQFRNINYKKETNLLKFLVGSISSPWINEASRYEPVLEYMKTSDNMLIIFDGFDEAPLDWNEVDETLDIYKPSNANIFLVNLLQGKLFPNIMKIITARPRQLNKVKINEDPPFTVNILGLSDTSQEELCKSIFPNNFQKITNFIRNQPNLSSYCFVPVNMILVADCVNQIMSTTNASASLPTSMSSVLSITLVHFLETPQMRAGHLETKQLSELAWYGFSENIYTFKGSDLSKLDDKTIETFLVTFRQKKKPPLLRGSKEASFFAHLLLQEYFSAIFLLFFLPIECFESKFFPASGRPKFDLNSDKFEIVLLFLFGLCSRSTFEYLEEEIISCEFPLQQAKFLKDMILEKAADIDVKEEEGFQSFLRFCNLAYELQDDVYTQELSNRIDDHLFVSGQVLPSDVVSFFYVLNKRKHIISMEMSHSSFVGDSVTRFFVLLKKNYSCSNHMVLKNIRLDGIKFTENLMSEVSGCLCSIEELSLIQCKITPNGYQILTKEISALKDKIRNIDLTKSTFDDDGARHLACIVANVEVLKLIDCKLTDKEILWIIEGLQKRKFAMEELDLSRNKIGDGGAKHLSSTLNKAEVLILDECDISAEGAGCILEGFKNLQDPIKKLNLTRNKIGNVGSAQITSALNKVESLVLIDCDISNVETFGLMEEVKVKELVLSLNAFGDGGASHFANHLNKIQVLNLDSCNITDVGARLLSDGLKDIQNPMKELDLSCNEIGDDGAQHLASVLDRVENLIIDGCNITEIGAGHLSEGIIKSLKPMKLLSLCMNDLGISGYRSLSRSAGKIEKLNIGDDEDESFTTEKLKAFTGNLKDIEHPMKELSVLCPFSNSNEVREELISNRNFVQVIKCNYEIL